MSAPRVAPSFKFCVKALAASDDGGVEAVLAAGQGAAAAASGLVAATVRRLPPAAVLPFLQRLVNLLAARPSRCSSLLAWLRALLAAHAGYLLTLPRLVPALEALYTLIDGRLSAHKKLLRVSGRLALLLGRAWRQPRCAPGCIGVSCFSPFSWSAFRRASAL